MDRPLGVQGAAMPNDRGQQTVTGRLREAIQASGQSLNQLAKESRVGADRLSRFVRGQRQLRGDAIDRLCDVLGLELTSQKPTKGK
jgi:transcriptional regulator with XRE-family HTH domain